MAVAKTQAAVCRQNDMKALTFLTASLSAAVSLSAVYDGSQSNIVFEASVVGEKRATLLFRVQSPTNENAMYVVLAEYGQFFTNNSFRVTFNGRRERRICGFYGDRRVYSAPGIRAVIPLR